MTTIGIDPGTISMHINLKPHGQMRSRATARGRFAKVYKAKEQRLEEDKLAALLYEHKPATPWSGPIRLIVQARFRPPKSSKKKTAAMLEGRTKHTKKPDVDNIVKHLKDVMSGVFYLDDKQIVEVIASKSYAECAHYDIVLEQLENE